MSHELLNNLWGNSLFKASTAERMSQRIGSHAFDLMENVTESLAGRIAIVHLLGFSHAEVDRKSTRLNSSHT